MTAGNITVDNGTLGFPRMGPNRELKFALEKFWRKKINEAELRQVATQVEEKNWQAQIERGIQRIAVGMFSLYDHVLDWTFYLGCEPARFQHISNDIERYFAMARGLDGIHALDMTKWFDTNYHYEVPELNNHTKPTANFSSYINTIKRAHTVIGKERTVPVILGPLTYLALSKYENTKLEAVLESILPLYQGLLNDLAALGVKEVQIHEPSLVSSRAANLVPHLAKVYGTKESTGVLKQTNLALNIVTYFDSIDDEAYKWFLESKVEALSLDFTRGDNISVIEKYGFPSGKRLGAGVVDGRAIWKFDPIKTNKILKRIVDVVGKLANGAISVQPSSSLQHVPYTTACETNIKDNNETGALHGVLSFAYEKLDEIKLITKAIQNGGTVEKDAFESTLRSWNEYYEANPEKSSVTERVGGVTEADLNRPSIFSERRPHQMKNLPILPTTTIGSFPQTAQIRNLRRQLKTNAITLSTYEARIDEQIAFNIGIQEALGLDILVHGEPERTDMVEYFAEKLNGFAFTQNGWVQSYGSRCVRPPIIFADLERPNSMTVREFRVAQSFTSKPVKGMLTGPVTILNWSFPRLDISRQKQAYQLAICLRDEVFDLEQAGCQVIQMDEPALREGMPLKIKDKDAYLRWAVDAFRLSTAVAQNQTSIHTHMCYCEFSDCMHSIDEIDADVNSIENARSGDETIREFKAIGYGRDLGPGTYDIHSPVVPPKQEIVDKLKSFLALLPAKQIVVNPDCGLKTRKWPETIAALRNMVDATLEIRASLKN